MNRHFIFTKKMTGAVSLVLSLVLAVSCFYAPVLGADETLKLQVKTELDATAEAMLNNVKSNIADSKITQNDFKNYSLILKAGKSDSAVTLSLLNFIKDNFNNDGTANITGTFSPEIWYGYIITFLNEIGENSSDFNGINFNKLLEDYYLEPSNDINIYMEQYITAAVTYNPSSFSKSDDMLKKANETVLSAYLSDASGTGIDYWGVSADNNGQCLIVLKPSYNDNADIKSKVDNALTWITTQLSPNNAVLSWGSESANSTALGLKAFAEFGDMDNAAKVYNGLLSLKAADTPGAYIGYDGNADLNFSTPDALLGLLAYYRALDGKSTLDVVKPAEPETPAETTTEPETSAVEESTTDIETTTVPVSAPIDGDTPATGDFSPIVTLLAILAVSGVSYTLILKRQTN